MVEHLVETRAASKVLKMATTMVVMTVDEKDILKVVMTVDEMVALTAAYSVGTMAVPSAH